MRGAEARHEEVDRGADGALRHLGDRGGGGGLSVRAQQEEEPDGGRPRAAQHQEGGERVGSLSMTKCELCREIALIVVQTSRFGIY